LPDYTYTTVPGKIPDLLRKIRETGLPPKATRHWLTTIGFKGSNDRTLLRVLKFINFADGSGVPGELWKDYRGSGHGRALGAGILKGYADLFNTYPDAHNRNNKELEDFFGSKTSAGRPVIELMVRTFKTLSAGAEFGEAELGQPLPIPAGDSMVGSTPIRQTAVTRVLGSALTVNINIQLTLPDTTDEQVYEKFFAAMKKHLLSDEAS
jgi:hypothetical protein